MRITLSLGELLILLLLAGAVGFGTQALLAGDVVRETGRTVPREAVRSSEAAAGPAKGIASPDERVAIVAEAGQEPFNLPRRIPQNMTQNKLSMVGNEPFERRIFDPEFEERASLDPDYEAYLEAMEARQSNEISGPPRAETLRTREMTPEERVALAELALQEELESYDDYLADLAERAEERRLEREWGDLTRSRP